MTLSIQRLPSTLFPVLFKTGKRIYTPMTVCMVLPSDDRWSRYAIHISSKVQKSAVKRNRIKRIIRTALQHICAKRTSALLCIVQVKKDCSLATSAAMQNELAVLQTL